MGEHPHRDRSIFFIIRLRWPCLRGSTIVCDYGKHQDSRQRKLKCTEFLCHLLTNVHLYKSNRGVTTSMIARHKMPHHDLIVVFNLKSCGAAEKSLGGCLRCVTRDHCSSQHHGNDQLIVQMV